ncbi:MAG: TRAP transporter large permease subunit [Myxococcota bacterium]|nr:TRAP transporter large permease subunit [Myxococcota bacterium]
MSFLRKAAPSWDTSGYVGGAKVPVEEPQPKASPVALVAAFVVLLVANLYGLADGRGVAGTMAAHVELALLVVTALAFSRKPAAAVIVALLSLWMYLSLDPGVFVVLGAALTGVLLGLPLFAIIGVVTVGCLTYLSEGDKSYETMVDFTELIRHITALTDKEVLLAIPFFVISGAIMTGGVIAQRLIELAKALVGWMPGGLAIATVGACIFFAAISGSSPVTVIAIGSMMYPALVKAGYREPFSLGLVTSAGSLGILIPPSIPMIVYSIMVSGSAAVDPRDLFIAGVGPGFLIGGLLSLYGIKEGLRSERGLAPEVRRGMLALGAGLIAASAVMVLGGMSGLSLGVMLSGVGLVGAVVLAFLPIDWRELGQVALEGLWALLLPVVILGGIYSGLFNATEAAAVAVVYAVFVERFIYSSMNWREMMDPLMDSVVMMGALLIIIGMALGFNAYLVDAQIPDRAVAWLVELNLGKIGFLLLLNLFLLVVGALMDILSAILIIAPLLAPMAIKLGIDPVHLGVIFIVNLEIGYLTPPMGLNLFVSSGLFNRPVGDVIKSTFPFTRLMLLGLLLVTYVPAISLAPVEWLAEKPPELAAADSATGSAGAAGGGGSSKTTMADLMAAAGIDDDEDDLDDEDFDDEDVGDDDVSSSSDEAAAATPEQLDALRRRIDALERALEAIQAQTSDEGLAVEPSE